MEKSVEKGSVCDVVDRRHAVPRNRDATGRFLRDNSCCGVRNEIQASHSRPVSVYVFFGTPHEQHHSCGKTVFAIPRSILHAPRQSKYLYGGRRGRPLQYDTRTTDSYLPGNIVSRHLQSHVAYHGRVPTRL